MTGFNWERWSRAAGIGFVVLYVVGFIVLSEPPKVNASADDVVSFFDGDRSRVLTAMVIFGIAFALLLFFVGAIANVLREAGQGWFAATTLAAGTTFVALQAGIGAIAGGLSLNIARIGDEGVVTSLNVLTGSLDVMAAFPLAFLILLASVGLARARVLPGWYSWFGTIVAIVVLLHGTNWSRSGFWSATGGYVWVTIGAGLVWAAVTSWMLFSRAPTTEPAPESAAARPT
jgi:hypothetical protein